MKKLVYIFCISMVVFSSCSKQSLKVDDYSETRHTIRFYMELSTITECIGNYFNGSEVALFQANSDVDSATLDSIYLPSGPFNNDGRERFGDILITHYGLSTDSATVFSVSTNYYRDSLQIEANFQYFNTSIPGTYRFQGTLTFTYITGLQATFEFNMSNVFLAGNATFPKGYYYLYGDFEATDSDGAAFSADIQTPLRSYECNNYGSDNDSYYKRTYLENGMVSLTTSKQGTGELWFGYNDICDTYCVVLWKEKDIQLNIDMVNY
jgi:hypothetical protein